MDEMKAIGLIILPSWIEIIWAVQKEVPNVLYRVCLPSM